MRLALLFAFTVAAMPAVVTAAPLPRFSGNLDIADQIVHRDARMIMLGDSIQNEMGHYYLSTWQPDHVSGQVVSGNFAHSFGSGDVAATVFTSHSQSWLERVYRRTPDVSAVSEGVTAIAPGATLQPIFKAGVAGAVVNQLSNRVLDAQLSPNQASVYAGGNWAQGKPVTFSALAYANPGAQANGLRFNLWTGNGTSPAPLATVPVSGYAPAAQYRSFTATATPTDWSNGFSATLQVDGGTTLSDGANLPIVATRFTTGNDGFQLDMISQGSKGVEHYLDPANATDAAVAAYLGFTDANIAYLWLGQNDGHTKAEWKNRIESIMDRYSAAQAGMRFVLVSSYDTGGDKLPEYAEALHELSLARNDALFLNLYGEFGTFEQTNGVYLADGVHPNNVGRQRIATQTWGLISDASAAVPEPSGLGVAVLSLAALTLKRRKRSVSLIG